MKNNIPIETKVIQPSIDAVFRGQGINKNYSPSLRIRSIVEKALDDFLILAKPVGIFKEISVTEFKKIFDGEGLNDDSAPLKNIYPLADRMALYAITLGAEISNFIENLFNNNDYVLGYTLDTVASIGADNASELMENQYGMLNSGDSTNTLVLGYSPGYCGWHVSGQKKLFEHLQPETIGISLNTSFLMNPLKSVTGLIVKGHRDIHQFKPNFPFCRGCLTHSCVERFKKLTIIEKEDN